jgi:hypothetical protein
MWFLLLAIGAVLVQLVGVPASRRLAVPPSPEALLVAWFLLATAVRLAVLRVRLAALERKARRLARRASDQGPSPIGELGLGVGRGALQAVGGDVIGASLSVVAGLLRGAAGSLRARPTPQKERRRSARRERLTAMACVLGVGLTCAGLTWWPLVRTQATQAALPALRSVGLAPEPPGAPRPPPATPHARVASPVTNPRPGATP